MKICGVVCGRVEEKRETTVGQTKQKKYDIRITYRCDCGPLSSLLSFAPLSSLPLTFTIKSPLTLISLSLDVAGLILMLP
jgi:hypothetical protein